MLHSCNKSWKSPNKILKDPFESDVEKKAGLLRVNEDPHANKHLIEEYEQMYANNQPTDTVDGSEIPFPTTVWTCGKPF